MKKKSILLILLLSVQLSGCSNKQPDLPVQEFSLTEENGLKEKETALALIDSLMKTQPVLCAIESVEKKKEKKGKLRRSF